VIEPFYTYIEVLSGKGELVILRMSIALVSHDVISIAMLDAIQRLTPRLADTYDVFMASKFDVQSLLRQPLHQKRWR
jgi:hypothetical protein